MQKRTFESQAGTRPHRLHLQKNKVILWKLLGVGLTALLQIRAFPTFAAEPGVFTVKNDQSLKELYQPGSGARYKILISNDATPIDLSIYVSESGKDHVGFEFFMRSQSMLGEIKMWQQFQLVRKSGASGPELSLERGLFRTPELKKPEILPLDELLKQMDSGLQISDFMITSTAPKGHQLIGKEALQVGKANLTTYHFQYKNKERTIDYWIHPDVKPIALIKMKASGPKPQHNYELVFQSLVVNVAREIDPQTAAPLSATGRSLLGLGK